jgi:uncharacterized protein with beta-barrel porin domain
MTVGGSRAATYLTRSNLVTLFGVKGAPRLGARLVSDPSLAAASQALPGAGFIVNGAAPAKDSALVSAGAELRLANGVALFGKSDAEFASRSATYAGTGTMRYAW